MKWNLKERIIKHNESISHKRFCLETSLLAVAAIGIILGVYVGVGAGYERISHWWTDEKPAATAQVVPVAPQTKDTERPAVTSEVPQQTESSPASQIAKKKPSAGISQSAAKTDKQDTTSAVGEKPKLKQEPDSDIKIETAPGSQNSSSAIEKPYDCGLTDCQQKGSSAGSGNTDKIKNNSADSTDTAARPFQKVFEPNGDIQLQAGCIQRGTEIRCAMKVRNVGDARHNFYPEKLLVLDEYGNSYKQSGNESFEFDPHQNQRWLDPGLGGKGWVNFTLTVHNTRPVADSNATVTIDFPYMWNGNYNNHAVLRDVPVIREKWD